MENNEENKEKLKSKKLIEDLNNLEDDENSKKAKLKEKLKNNSENFIIILAVIILVICLVVYYFRNKEYSLDEQYSVDYGDKYFSEFNNYISNGYDEQDDEYISDLDDGLFEIYDEEQERVKFETQKANIVISNTYTSVNNELILNVVNNNSEIISDLEIYLIFYNENNQIIDIIYETLDFIDANSSEYLKYEETVTNYSRYETFIKKSNYFSGKYENKKENISYTHFLDDGAVVINLTNNSKEDIEYIEFSVIYYDGQNNILDIEQEYAYDLNANSSTEFECFDIYNYETGENIPFERYEVILNYAI